MSHRVKNSLTSVVGLLRVQARNAQSQDVKSALEDASLRVSTIAEVHDHLWRSSHVGFIELADFMTELCKSSGATSEYIRSVAGRMRCCSSPTMPVPLGLLINELVAKAIKYAYPDGSGAIEVSAREIDGSLHVEVSDQGKGLPQGFDIDEPRASLGFKVITGMVRQLRGHLTVDNDRKGSRFLLELPIILRSDRSPSACPERHGRMGSRGRILELDNLDCEASKRTSASHAPQIFLTRFGGGQVIVSEQSAGGQRSSFMWVRPTYSRRRPR
jgi:two-component sensor histidine kinase